MSNVIVVGDVHGCLEELRELLERAKYVPNVDKVYLLGDLVDRGPDSAGVVQYARKHNLACVKGNHDDKHIRFRKHMLVEKAGGKKNPMKFRDTKLDDHLALTDDDIAWMDQLPVAIFPPELPGWVLVHAGFNPFHGSTRNITRESLFIRYIDAKTKKTVGLDKDLQAPANSEWWFDHWYEPIKVMYGHAVHSYQDPLIVNNCYGIDTGCCFGGRLTGAIFTDPTKEPYFLQIDAYEDYAKRFDTDRSAYFVDGPTRQNFNASSDDDAIKIFNERYPQHEILFSENSEKEMRTVFVRRHDTQG